MADEDDLARWSRLTEKHRASLDLLLERMTSKEIARVLDVAKATVDQRLTAARSILGVTSRDKAAIEYARLKQIYDRITYDPMHIPSSPKLVPSNFADGDPTDVIQLIHRQGGGDDAGGGAMGLALPFTGFLGHDHRTAARVTIMTSMLIALLIVLLAGLGIAQALSHLVSD